MMTNPQKDTTLVPLPSGWGWQRKGKHGTLSAVSEPSPFVELWVSGGPAGVYVNVKIMEHQDVSKNTDRIFGWSVPREVMVAILARKETK